MSEPLSSSGNIGNIENVAKPNVTSADDINLFLRTDDKPNVNADKTNVDKSDDKIDTDEAEVEEEIKLKDDDDKDEKIKLDEDDEDKKDSKKDKNDDDEDEDEDDEDKKDEIELDTPPRKKEILAKFPTIFKEFPWFEKMIYRDRQYTELFGSFDDAKEAAEQVEVLNAFEHDLLAGKTETILSKVKEIDKKAFDKLVDNYLPTLAKVDKEAYLEVVGSVSKKIIAEMVNEARNIGENNKDASQTLKQAALVLNQFLFGSSTYTPHRPRVEAKAEQVDEKVKQERLEYVRERFEDVRSDLQSKVDKILRSTISEYIDPKGEMSSFVKKHAVREALSTLHNTIGEDRVFRKNLDKLWDNVFSTRFSKDSQSRIQKTYLGKAKSHLKDVIHKARAEALKDRPSRTSSNNNGDEKEREKSERSEERPKKGPISSGRPHQSSGKLIMKKGESVMDFLSRD